MTRLVKDMMAKCPETKIVLSGYSQGAELVHGTLANLGKDSAKIGVSSSAIDSLQPTC